MIGASPPMQKVYELIERVADADADGADHRRERHRQGAGRARAPPAQPQRHRPVRRDQLRGDARGAARERAVRTRQGRVHRRARAAPGALPQGQRRHAVPRRDRRDAARRCSPSSCARCRSARCARSAAISEIPFDARIIAATNRDLETEVEERRFREDLFYRINVVRIDVPPLRARGSDVLLLAQHFVEQFSRQTGKKVTGLSPPVAEKLLAYAWPGNVRELQNCIERAVALTRFDELDRRRSAGEDPRLPVDATCRSPASSAHEMLADGRGRAPLHPARARSGRRQQDAGGASCSASIAARSTASSSAGAARRSSTASSTATPRPVGRRDGGR